MKEGLSLSVFYPLACDVTAVMRAADVTITSAQGPTEPLPPPGREREWDNTLTLGLIRASKYHDQVVMKKTCILNCISQCHV